MKSKEEIESAVVKLYVARKVFEDMCITKGLEVIDNAIKILVWTQ